MTFPGYVRDKAMKELLAFVVLSLPILVPLGIALVGVIAVWLVMRRVKSPGRKWKAGLVTALIFFLIPTWDILLGRAYFYYLCATEGGIKIYGQVELPKEYWDEEGRPRFASSTLKCNVDVKECFMGCF
jgi:hypothetical protein